MLSDQLSLGVAGEHIPRRIASVESDEAYTTDTDRYPILRTVSSFFGEGGIGLDPTSNAEKSVPAKHHFTKDDNCLARDWRHLGPVFMNPPYRRSKPFLEKMIHEFQVGHTPEAICLILSTQATNRVTASLLQNNCHALCMIHGRPFFRFGTEDRKGEIGQLTVGSVMFYLGRRRDEFVSHFSRIGTTAAMPTRTDLIKGLGAAQRKALMALARYGPMRQNRIAFITNCSDSAVSKAMTSLRERELVTSSPPALTTKGLHTASVVLEVYGTDYL